MCDSVLSILTAAQTALSDGLVPVSRSAVSGSSAPLLPMSSAFDAYHLLRAETLLIQALVSPLPLAGLSPAVPFNAVNVFNQTVSLLRVPFSPSGTFPFAGLTRATCWQTVLQLLKMIDHQAVVSATTFPACVRALVEELTRVQAPSTSTVLRARALSPSQVASATQAASRGFARAVAMQLARRWDPSTRHVATQMGLLRGLFGKS
jgi:hypothetical protein